LGANRERDTRASEEVSHRVHLRPIARIEFDEAVDWFEEKHDGLGIEFTDAVRDVLSSVAETPLIYRKLYRDVRAVSVKGFPYQIFYRILNDDSVEVLSVFQVRRDPRIWRGRSE